MAEYPEIAECGSQPGAPVSLRAVVEARAGKDGREYRLEQASEGYESAGSMMRWTDGYWAVSFDFEGARHGRRFKEEADARTLFDQWAPPAADLAATLRALGESLPDGSRFAFDLREDGVFLEALSIPEEARGVGTAFLAKVISAVDFYGLPATLYADPTDEPGDPETFHLARWYARFGFALDHVNEDEWVGMRRESRPWRGGAEAVLADYREAKARDLSQDAFEEWREKASADARSSPRPGV
jgi:hypothetical protein